tara:strand:- start:77 stop:760 length:684 start_codon:yes stop_codon:yes gene_type:complete
MSIEETFKKRFQARRFLKDKIPDKELIKSLLEKTFELVPSKQSLVPYRVNVLGPEHLEMKRKLYKLSSWHWETHKERSRKSIEKIHYGTIQMLAPYLIFFTDREVNDYNPSVLKKIQKGEPYPVLKLGKKERDKAVEIGMFSKILTGLCLEQDLAVSYTKCFPNDDREVMKDFMREQKEKGTVPEIIDVMESHVLLVMSIGYSDARKNFIKDFDEYKPPIENVIKWI